MDGGDPTARWVVRATPQEVSRLRRTVVRWSAGHGVDEPTLSDLQLALSESLTNAVLHGYADREPGDVVVEAAVDEHRHVVELVVRDAGRGVAPRRDSPGSGFGMPLMASLTESLDLRIDPRTGGTEVEMTFRFDGAKTPA